MNNIYMSDTFPVEKYKIIYADPPWPYSDSLKHLSSFGAKKNYPLMSLDAIKELPIGEIADDDSILFLWVTSPFLIDGIDVMREWGFKYRTIGFVWSKKSVNGKQLYNMGRWTMGSVEICLIGIRGRPQRIVKNVKQLVETVRRKHSEKPEEVRSRIVEMMGDVSRIELFSRHQVEGWDSWGNEIGR